jgi:hypothetical protein
MDWRKPAMNAIRILQTLALTLAPALAFAPTTVFAAHAGDPYRNVDHSNDMGNDTGDSRVDGLNSSQLNGNYRGPLELRAPAASLPTAQTPPAYPPR